MARREDPQLSVQGAVSRPRIDRAETGGSHERELLRRVSRRDVHAFETLYRLYQPRLTRFLSNLVQRRGLVEEVLDDTMMVVWQTADRFRGASKLSTWIFAIAYRKAMKAKMRWPDPVEEQPFDPRVSNDPGTDPAPDQQLQHRKLHDALVAAMETLSADHRAVVDLTYFHGMGYREIAEIMDCPVDTVKTRMFHARRKLKQVMSGNLFDWI